MFTAGGNKLSGKIILYPPSRFLVFLFSFPYIREEITITYEFDFQGDGRGTTYALEYFNQSVYAGGYRTEMEVLGKDITYEIKNKHQEKGSCVIKKFLGGYSYIGLTVGPNSRPLSNYGGLTVDFQLSNFIWNGKRIGFETDSHQG